MGIDEIVKNQVFYTEVLQILTIFEMKNVVKQTNNNHYLLLITESKWVRIRL